MDRTSFLEDLKKYKVDPLLSLAQSAAIAYIRDLDNNEKLTYARIALARYEGAESVMDECYRLPIQFEIAVAVSKEHF